MTLCSELRNCFGAYIDIETMEAVRSVLHKENIVSMSLLQKTFKIVPLLTLLSLLEHNNEK